MCWGRKTIWFVFIITLLSLTTSAHAHMTQKQQSTSLQNNSEGNKVKRVSLGDALVGLNNSLSNGYSNLKESLSPDSQIHFSFQKGKAIGSYLDFSF